MPRHPTSPRVLAVFAAFAVLSACRGRETSTGKASKGEASRSPAIESSDVAALPARPAGAAPAVIWVGLDGLDWELLDRLAAEGRLPNWKRLVGEGWSARLASEYPLLSPILWTTAATGVSPDVHRVLDFQEVDPATGRKVPISGASRAVPAVWNVASAVGRRVGVVGWWATHPAERVNGFFVSDHAGQILFSGLTLAGAAYPETLGPGVAQVVARDGKIEADDLTPYLDVPASEVAETLASNAGMENRVVALARILSATRATQRIARDLYDRERPALTAVYFEGTDEVGHVFAPFTPPRLECPSVSDADAARYGRVVARYYETMDAILGQWMRRAAADGAVLLVHSDHGFKWGADRPCGFAASSASTAAFWHRPEGVLAVWGRGVRTSAERVRATLYDVAPTVLGLLGLSADRRMPGAPLVAALPGLTPPPKKDAFSGVAVARVAAAPASSAASDEYAKKLLALGYLSPREAQPLAPTGGEKPGMTEGAWNNLGLYYMKREPRPDPAGARAAFEKSLLLRPDYYSPMFNLALLARDAGDARAAEDWLFRSLAAAGSDPAPAIAGWARDYERAGKAAPARSLLERATKTFPSAEPIARELARLRYREKNCPGAVAALSAFEPTTTDPQTLNDLALFHTCLADREAVIRLLERSLAANPNQPAVAQSLERVRAAE